MKKYNEKELLETIKITEFENQFIGNLPKNCARKNCGWPAYSTNSDGYYMCHEHLKQDSPRKYRK